MVTALRGCCSVIACRRVVSRRRNGRSWRVRRGCLHPLSRTGPITADDSCRREGVLLLTTPPRARHTGPRSLYGSGGSRVVLVAGFGSYPGVLVNDSEHIAREVANAHSVRVGSANVGFRGMVLPVEFRGAASRVLDRLHELGGSASVAGVVIVGTAPGDQGARVERQARNFQHATIPDARGVLATGQTIEPNGPPWVKTSVDVPAVVADIAPLVNMPVHVSDDAGSYVCNEIYYRLLAEMPRLPVVFVHVPSSGGRACSGAHGDVEWGGCCESARVVQAVAHTLAHGQDGRTGSPQPARQANDGGS